MCWFKRGVKEENVLIEIKNNSNHNQAKILVMGVGGGGNNALTHMSEVGIDGVQFIALNTDVQHLDTCNCETKLQIGEKLTKGLGAGSNPSIGEQAAKESEEMIEEAISEADMVILTCGMGGGTGTGATPFIASLAKEMDKLTVAVVTKPFTFEGKPKMEKALEGIEKLRANVDSIVIVPNDKLMSIADKNISYKDALKKVDEVLMKLVMAITDIVYKTQDVTLDFADIRTAMSNKGTAHIGIGIGKGENKAKDAVDAAVNNPMLETSIQGATDLLVNISGEASYFEYVEASQHLHSLVGEETNIYPGYDSTIEQAGELKVTIIATGVTQAATEKKIIPPANQVGSIPFRSSGFKTSSVGMNYSANPVSSFKMPSFLNTSSGQGGKAEKPGTGNAQSISTTGGYMSETNIDSTLLSSESNQRKPIDIPDFLVDKNKSDK